MLPFPFPPYAFDNSASQSVKFQFAVFNSARKGPDINLTGNNLIATQSTAASFESVLATNGHSTGKYFCSFVCNVLVGVSTGVGIANAAASMATYFGFDTNGADCFANTQTFINNANVGTCSNFIALDVVDLATDLTNGFIWTRRNGGNWNGNASADPANNTIGAVSLAAMVGGGPFFPGVTVFTNTDSFTANFGASAYSFAAPSGFLNW